MSVVGNVVELVDRGIAAVADGGVDDAVVDGSRDTKRKKERVVDGGNENEIADTDNAAAAAAAAVLVDDTIRWGSSRSIPSAAVEERSSMEVG